MKTEEDIRKEAVAALRSAGWENQLSNSEISATMIGIKWARQFEKFHVDYPYGVGQVPIYACKACGVMTINPNH